MRRLCGANLAGVKLATQEGYHHECSMLRTYDVFILTHVQRLFIFRRSSLILARATASLSVNPRKPKKKKNFIEKNKCRVVLRWWPDIWGVEELGKRPRRKEESKKRYTQKDKKSIFADIPRQEESKPSESTISLRLRQDDCCRSSCWKEVGCACISNDQKKDKTESGSLIFLTDHIHFDDKDLFEVN